jgi:ATP-dependent DNA ligase
MKKFPTLYKKTNTDAIQYWKISVDNMPQKDGSYLIVTEYGQKDTDKPQQTIDVVKTGKNIGKKNETTTQEQAYLEAQYKWEKQKKKGYCETVTQASAGEVDSIIEGGILPMLAHTYDKQGHKIVYPCYAQPKLDGHRCIAIAKDGKHELWTRTRKKITSVPHITEELDRKYPKANWILDGELYNHKFKNDFEHISHLVRQEEPDPNHKDVEYHIYDLVSTCGFDQRYMILEKHIKDLTYCVLVRTFLVKAQSEIKGYFNTFVCGGFEGIMLRNIAGGYENKRSYNLQKVKEFNDAEFKVIDIKEGKGKLRGHVGAFKCVQDDGTEFDVKMSGDTDKLKDYFNDKKLWKDKMLTVQFQGRSKYGIPRFPVGLRFREDL